INIGKNLTTPVSDAVDDYLICMKKVYTVADYIAVNVSSPNTPGLRDLQGEEQFAALARTLKTEQLRLAEQHGRYTPLVFKIAPDQAQDAIRAQAELLLELKVDGVIATNTTVSRDEVRGHAHAEEAGGLSGEPLAARATAVVAALSAASGGALPIIGVGGISDKASASEKIDAGANLVQIYTGFIYRGPSRIAEAVAGCVETFSQS
ncbi:MAG TPA: dihydroorotate dehydrogenase (quinone), partial [Porticoccaceae bacterium]|nr:dihydroorotate dehydrogenase (quinone) [Porticoccaceae bacterium]